MSSITMMGRVFGLAAILGTAAVAQPAGTQGPSAAKTAARPKTRNAAAPPAGQPDWAKIVLQRKPDFVLWDADRKIEPGTVGLVYDIEQVDRLRLLLKAPAHGLRGWSPSSEVISLDRAEAFFSQSIVSKPDDPFGYLMRGIARSEKGDAVGAMADLDEAIKRNPRYVPTLVRRAALLRSRQQPDRALADLDQAVAINERDSSAHVERAVLWFTRKNHVKAMTDLDRATTLGSRDVIIDIIRGQILLERKETKKAFEAFVHALQIDPLRHDAYLGLASVYLMRGQPKNGQAVLDDAVRADPSNPEAYGNRATFHLARGDYEQALSNLDEVIRVSPGSARAHNERAWLLATCKVEKFRDAYKAVESAKRACELTGGKNPRYLVTLAAACSETGDFDAAVQYQGQALLLIAENAPEKTEYRRLLDRYRAKKPHHNLTPLQELGIKSYQPAERKDS
jgi:tetratricopeptide (TPR) repeat protein